MPELTKKCILLHFTITKIFMLFSNTTTFLFNQSKNECLLKKVMSIRVRSKVINTKKYYKELLR